MTGERERAEKKRVEVENEQATAKWLVVNTLDTDHIGHHKN